MKKKRLIILITVLVILLITILGVLFGYVLPRRLSGLSASSSVNISCDKEKVPNGANVTCQVYVNVVSGKISSFTGDVRLSNNLSLVSSNYASNWSEFSTAKDGKFKLSTSNLYEGRVNIGTIVLRVNGGDNEAHSITLGGIKVGDENYNEVALNEVSKTIYTSSSNANLVDLSVSPGNLTPSFNENVSNYNVVTNSSSIVISAVASKSGSVSGTGQKNLNYGNNSFTITSVSEAGNSKTYTINVVRNDTRSSNNNLSNLSVSDTDIRFNSGTYNYNATVKYDVSSVNITATASDSKAGVQGLGSKSLKVGKNTFNVVVTAENGAVKTYTITIIRANKDGKITVSSDNSLKSLSIEGVDIEFNKNTLTYNVSVPNEVTEAKVSYETTSSKAVASISGNTALEVGENKIEINVTAEDGSIRTYVLNIIREKSVLKSENNEEEIVSKIKDTSNNDDIVVTVDEDDENKVISSNIINELINANKNLAYNVVDKEGKVLYKVKINSDKLVKDSEFSYYLTFKSDYEDVLNSLTENNLHLPLNFKFHGMLPGNIEFSIYVKDMLDTTKTYDLYYFNTKNNILELEINKVPITNGYADFELNHFSEYVLLEKKVAANKKSLVPIIIMVIIALIIIGLMIFITRKPKKKKEKLHIEFYKFEEAKQSNF